MVCTKSCHFSWIRIALIEQYICNMPDLKNRLWRKLLQMYRAFMVRSKKEKPMNSYRVKGQEANWWSDECTWVSQGPSHIIASLQKKLHNPRSDEASGPGDTHSLAVAGKWRALISRHLKLIGVSAKRQLKVASGNWKFCIVMEDRVTNEYIKEESGLYKEKGKASQTHLPRVKRI